jgi:hypothetical protein
MADMGVPVPCACSLRLLCYFKEEARKGSKTSGDDDAACAWVKFTSMLIKTATVQRWNWRDLENFL